MSEPVDPEISLQTVAIRSLTEFCAVAFQLVCLSRLGPNDINSQLEPSVAANLVLFVTLLIFQFPFLNGYILFMYDLCVIGRTSPKRIFFCFFIVGMQVAGVAIAWLIIRDIQVHWKGSITWISAPAQSTDDGRNLWAEFFEEFFAVLALLVGYIHLTYLNFQTREIQLFYSPSHFFSAFTPDALKLPVPLPFIMQVTLLVAGLLRAFPTSHLSPHISCYILIMGYTTWFGFLIRIFAGVVAFFMAYILFMFGYVSRTGVHPPAKRKRAQFLPQRVPAGKTTDLFKLPLVDEDSDEVPYDRVSGQSLAISFHSVPRHFYTYDTLGSQ